MTEPVKAINPTVVKFGKLNFTGNVIPLPWLQVPSLRHESGKPNLVAIMLLADIVYYYRPSVMRDEETGEALGWRQKFKADRLQKDYGKWGALFGFTVRQVEDAMAFLKGGNPEGLKLVDVEQRTVETAYGRLPNRAFIEPVFSAIVSITFPDAVLFDSDGIPLQRAISPVITGDCLPSQRAISPPTTGDNPKSHNTENATDRKVKPAGKPPDPASGQTETPAEKRRKEQNADRVRKEKESKESASSIFMPLYHHALGLPPDEPPALASYQYMRLAGLFRGPCQSDPVKFLWTCRYYFRPDNEYAKQRNYGVGIFESQFPDCVAGGLRLREKAEKDEQRKQRSADDDVQGSEQDDDPLAELLNDYDQRSARK
jgi:hypothetical protein